jgi:hypothetical protein
MQKRWTERMASRRRLHRGRLSQGSDQSKERAKAGTLGKKGVVVSKATDPSETDTCRGSL